MNINNEQFSLLDQFVDKTADAQPAEQEEVSSPRFLNSLGLEKKFKNAGIDFRTIGKDLLDIAGPMMPARMMSGRRGGNQQAGMSGGGIGSLISGLSSGRGFGTAVVYYHVSSVASKDNNCYIYLNPKPPL